MSSRYVVRIRTPDGGFREVRIERGARIELAPGDRVEMAADGSTAAADVFLEGNDLITELRGGAVEIAFDLDNSLTSFGEYFFPLPALRLLGLNGLGLAESVFRSDDVPGQPAPASIATLPPSEPAQEPLPSATTPPPANRPPDPPPPTNRPPDALDDSGSTNRDVPLTFTAASLLANDSDLDGDPLTITGVGSAVNGTATLNADGSVTFTPNSSFTGDASFVYSVADGRGGTDSATVNIVVSAPPPPSNNPPDARNDAAYVQEDGPLQAAGALMANDLDTDGDPLVVVAASFGGAPLTIGTATSLLYGTLTVQSNGSFSYVLDNANSAVQAIGVGDTLTETVVYTVSDGRGGTDAANLTITIYGKDETGSPQPPRIDDQLLTIAEGSTGPLLPVASDPDGATAALRWAIVGGTDAGFFNIDAASGALSFKAAPDFEAPADFGANNIYQLVLRVTDDLGTGLSDSGIVNVQVLDVNETPALADRRVSLYEQGATTVATLAGSDPDRVAPNNSLTYSIVAGVGDGALFSIDAASGELRFVTAPDFETPLDVAFGGDPAGNNVYHVVVRATDGGSPGLFDDAVVEVTVLDINEALPLAVALQDQPGNLLVGSRLHFLDTTPVLEVQSTAGAIVQIDWNDGRGFVTVGTASGGVDRFELDSAYTYGGKKDIVVRATLAGSPETEVATRMFSGLLDYVFVDGNRPLTELPPSQGFTLTARSVYDSNQSYGKASFLRRALALGDINGDGLGDLLIAAQGETPTGTEASNDGLAYVVYGKAGAAFPTTLQSGLAQFDLTSLAPQDGFVIRGLPYKFAQQEAIGSSGRDINGDGKVDFSLTTRLSNSADAGVSDDWFPGVNRGPNTAGNDAPVLPNQAFEHPEGSLFGLQVIAGDADSESSRDGQFTYAIYGGADAGAFAIDPNTGVLRFVQFPDYEAPTDANGDNLYEVIVAAIDRGGDPSGLVGTGTVLVRVLDRTTDNGTSTGNTPPVIWNQDFHIREDQNDPTTWIVAPPWRANEVGGYVRFFDGDSVDESLGLVPYIVGGPDASKFTVPGFRGFFDSWPVLFVTRPNFESPTDADDPLTPVNEAGDNVYEVDVAVYDGRGGTDTARLRFFVHNVIEGTATDQAAVILGAGNAPGGMQQDSRGRDSLDATDLGADVGFYVQGMGTVRIVSDVDGDGFDDFFAAPRNSVGTPPVWDTGRTLSGWLIFGRGQDIGGWGTVDAAGRRIVDPTLLPADQALPIVTSSLSTRARFIFGDGDINGDGFTDLVFGDGAYSYSGADRAWVVFGGARGGLGTFSASRNRRELFVDSITPNQGFLINGNNHPFFPIDTEFADVDGDGFDDLVLTAEYGNAASGQGTGTAMVVFGRDAVAGSAFGTLTAGGQRLIDWDTLRPEDGFIFESDVRSFVGSGVTQADVNGDGLADLVVTGAVHTFPAGQRGDVYVVFGQADRANFGTLDGLGRRMLRVGAANSEQLLWLAGGTNRGAGLATTAIGDLDGDGLPEFLYSSRAAALAEAEASARFPLQWTPTMYVVYSRDRAPAEVSLPEIGALDAYGFQPTLTFSARPGVAIAIDWGDGAGFVATGLTGTGLAQTASLATGYRELGPREIRIRTTDSAGDQTVRTLTYQPGRLNAEALPAAAGFALGGAAAGDELGRSAVLIGDINGDGYEDFAIAAPLSDVNGVNSGAVFVIYGQAGTAFGALDGLGGRLLDLGEAGAGGLPPERGFVIVGAANEQLGSASGVLYRGIAALGDVDGDGFDDFAVGRFVNSGPSPVAVTYVIFGRDTAASPFGTLAADGRRVLATADLSAGEAVIVRGVDAGNAQGGDLNGDGFDDITLGFERGSLNPRPVLLFGRADRGWGTLAASGPRVLDLTSGVITDAATGFGLRGRSADFADINGDGFDDLIVESYSDSLAIPGGGVAQVIFGRAGTSFANTLIAGGGYAVDPGRLSPAEGVVFEGFQNSRPVGVGDLDGDGFEDLAFVAGSANAYSSSLNRALYVVFGGAVGTLDASGRRVVNLASLTPAQGFSLEGKVPGEFGDAVSAAGDVNGDGFDDLIVSGFRYGAQGYSGAAYVVFGRADRSDFGALIRGRTIGLDPGVGLSLIGGVRNGFVGSDVSGAGDINGDGFDDLLVTGYRRSDDGTDAGRAWVVFGADFTRAATTAGTTAAEILIGSSAGDTLSGGGGADVLRGGAGDDRLRIGDLGFSAVDGGEGFDVLAYSGGGTLEAAAARMAEVEAIDLAGGDAATLVLTAAGVLGIGGHTAAGTTTLLVRGDAADRVRIEEDGWSAATVVTIDGVTYRSTTRGAVRVLVEGDSSSGAALELGAAPAPLLSLLELLPGSDTNVANNDGFTADATPTLRFTAAAGATVTIDWGDGVVQSVGGTGSAQTLTRATPYTADGSYFVRAAAVLGDCGSPLRELPLIVDRSIVNGRFDVGAATTYEGGRADGAGVVGGTPWSRSSGATTGTALAGGFDFNGDSIADFLMGAPDLSASSVRGSARITLGAPDFRLAAFGNRTTGQAAEGGEHVQVAIALAAPTAAQLGSALASPGDVNGDGFDDVLIGSRLVGTYLVYGRSLAADEAISLAPTTPGAWQASTTHGEVAAAGDFNGDGFADFLLSQRTSAGTALLYLGGGGNPTLASTITGLGGTWALSMAGGFDFNNDGRQDLLLGAPSLNGQSGAAFVVFGQTTTPPATLNLNQLAPSQGFVLAADNAGDQIGSAVARAGDVNGDGVDDIVVAARFGDRVNAANDASGEVYVLFGRVGASGTEFASSLDGAGRAVLGLGSLAPAAGFVLTGAAPSDQLGAVVAGGGDFNGDGFGDLIVSSINAFNGAGAAYVLFGRASGWGTLDSQGRASVNILNLAPGQGFRIDGQTVGDQLGAAVAWAGDVNGDGYDDLLVGAPGWDAGSSGSNLGAAHLIYGFDTGAASSAALSVALAEPWLDLSQLPSTDDSATPLVADTALPALDDLLTIATAESPAAPPATDYPAQAEATVSPALMGYATMPQFEPWFAPNVM